MPTFKIKLSREEVWKIIAYMRAGGFQRQSISTLANSTTPLQWEINQQQQKLDPITTKPL